jgi:uncharacterized lipoprotein NlpE involved in copper resistance
VRLKVVTAMAVTSVLAGCTGASDRASSAIQAAPAFVGAQACFSCHARAYSEWATSDHHEAMQVANSVTVKGDFSGARFAYLGVESSFTAFDAAQR